MSINLKISQLEKETVVLAIRKTKECTISIAKLAKIAEINQYRVRFIVDALIEEGRVEKIQTKSYNKHYSRYYYKVVS